jgi:hypothetical protein
MVDSSSFITFIFIAILKTVWPHVPSIQVKYKTVKTRENKKKNPLGAVSAPIMMAAIPDTTLKMIESMSTATNLIARHYRELTALAHKEVELDTSDTERLA